MAKVISTDELKQKIDSGDKYYLIDVLSPQSYEARHIPTAVNIPMGPDLPQKVEQLGAGKDDEIILYCSSSSCAKSPAAAAALASAGYTNATHYKDGLAGWQDAGYEFES
jgi:adenylyltransferase/sulfurtransferase